MTCGSAVRGKSIKMQSIDEGSMPLIAAARNNQGVAGYYAVDPMYENAITVSCCNFGNSSFVTIV